MHAYHNSQDIKYRSPFGAVRTDSAVSLRLDVSDTAADVSATVRLWYNDTERLVVMNKESDGNEFVFRAEISVPSDSCLLWYSFIIDLNGETIWYANTSQLGGIGGLCADGSAESYQITVYDKEFDTPEWFRGRIMYQIFPDRFYGAHKDGKIEKSREEYIIHYDRYEHISFNAHPYEIGPACNDFYGGNLRGICEKLPYIKSLGVGVIYLNPIFEAYSNHKYDTANYKRIDPMFGTEEDFVHLCKEAEKFDIKIILDGVFSHTGADSIYFNKYGFYGTDGAFHNPSSPYRSWYCFDENGGYTSWWGCSNLPNVNEMDDSYLDYILRDDDSVIKKWLRLGASGWRLDVADELPDEFIKILRKEVKSVKPDAVIIGEVWEDASNKVAYSKQREYLLGDELDSVMNYPFKDNITAYVMGWKSAEKINAALMSIYENYPIEVLYSLMNLLGTHDTMRIKSLFGGLNSDCGYTRLTSGNEDLASYRLMCAVFMQMTMPGVPSVYYGDEIGMQGGRDPFNRAPYPWRGIDAELLEKYRCLGGLRNSKSVLNSGFFRTLYANGDVFVYARYFDNKKDVFGKKCDFDIAVCAINRSFEVKTVTVDISDITVDTIKCILSSGRAEKAFVQSGRDIHITVPPVGYVMGSID